MDNEALNQRIIDAGIKKEKIAEALGVTPNTISRKLKGDSEFTASEIGTLAVLLQITPEDVARIFYPVVLN